MAGVLVRLRLSLQRGSRERTSQRISFVLGWLFGLGGGLVGGAIVAGADAARDGRGDLTVIAIFTSIFLSWMLGPILVLRLIVFVIAASVLSVPLAALLLGVVLVMVPVFLAGTQGISAGTWDAMDDIGVREVHILGGPGAVSTDVEEALNAANAIGDDRLQRQGQGTVVPESFTHGTSEQRVRWFRKGLQTGDVAQGDTFTARSL